MRKSLVIASLVILGTCFFCGAVFAWQGRMAGMGDPYGLVEDESDFLVNPAKIGEGQGTRYYGNYRFTYTDALDWKLRARGAPLSIFSSDMSASGNEYKHEAMLGAGLPAGAGRLGVFFEYSGKRSDFDADSHMPLLDFRTDSSMTSDLDNFALRVLYGQTLGNDLKLGAEIQLAYRDENNHYSSTMFGNGIPFLSGTNDFSGNLLPFMSPYDSQYWELLLKTGLEGNFGPLKTGFAIRGGSIFAGDNSWSNRSSMIGQGVTTRFGIGGDVEGWKLGGDLWLRYSCSQALSFPFLIRVDYSEKSRSGAGTALGWTNVIGPPFSPIPFFIGTDVAHNLAYNMEEDFLRIEAGGGFDLALSDSARVAAGLYYNYITAKHDLSVRSRFSDPFTLSFAYTGFPDLTEHLARFKLAGEKQLSPLWTIRGGLDIFGGFAREDYGSAVFERSIPDLSYSASMEGTHWGITASLGATTQCMGVTLQPFLNAGYQDLSINDKNARSILLDTPFSWNVQKDKREVLVGAGLSVLF